MDGHCTDGWCILRISKSRTSLQSDQFSVSNSTTSAAFLFNQYYYWLQLKCVQNIDICPLFSPSGELYLGLITYMSNHTFIVESTNISWLIRLGCKMDEKLWAMRFIHFWPSSSHRCNVHCEICISPKEHLFYVKQIGEFLSWILNILHITKRTLILCQTNLEIFISVTFSEYFWQLFY